jgi:hypothetical protein
MYAPRLNIKDLDVRTGSSVGWRAKEAKLRY